MVVPGIVSWYGDICILMSSLAVSTTLVGLSDGSMRTGWQVKWQTG